MEPTESTESMEQKLTKDPRKSSSIFKATSSSSDSIRISRQRQSCVRVRLTGGHDRNSISCPKRFSGKHVRRTRAL